MASLEELEAALEPVLKRLLRPVMKKLTKLEQEVGWVVGEMRRAGAAPGGGGGGEEEEGEDDGADDVEVVASVTGTSSGGSGARQEPAPVNGSSGGTGAQPSGGAAGEREVGRGSGLEEGGGLVRGQLEGRQGEARRPPVIEVLDDTDGMESDDEVGVRVCLCGCLHILPSLTLPTHAALRGRLLGRRLAHAHGPPAPGPQVQQRHRAPLHLQLLRQSIQAPAACACVSVCACMHACVCSVVR
jgi:hypothetical protein